MQFTLTVSVYNSLVAMNTGVAGEYCYFELGNFPKLVFLSA